MVDNYSQVNGMTDQQQILLASNNSVQDNSPTALTNKERSNLWTRQLASNIVVGVNKLNHIQLKQWLLLLLINAIAISFIVFAYICTTI